jgi:signal transduction histidine kinase
LRVGDLEVDLLVRVARRGECDIELLPREFQLVEYLAATLFDAFANIIDDAIKHGSGDIAIEQDLAGPFLSVSDRGPGIPLEQRDHLLRRFYRLERSRHSTGSGLGRSLVAAVAQLHGARVELADNAPGLRFTVHFLRAEAAGLTLPVRAGAAPTRAARPTDGA